MMDMVSLKTLAYLDRADRSGATPPTTGEIAEYLDIQHSQVAAFLGKMAYLGYVHGAGSDANGDQRWTLAPRGEMIHNGND